MNDHDVTSNDGWRRGPNWAIPPLPTVDADLHAIGGRLAYGDPNIGDDVRFLLGEVEKLRAEVERLKAGQIPDGGQWVTRYGHHRDDGQTAWAAIGDRSACDNVKRREWYGPVEPIALKSTESVAEVAGIESPTDG